MQLSEETNKHMMQEKNMHGIEAYESWQRRTLDTRPSAISASQHGMLAGNAAGRSQSRNQGLEPSASGSRNGCVEATRSKMSNGSVTKTSMCS